ncbi:amino acid ABC transporter permease [Halorubellus sp. JP-L1]|uniref:amino acid ABC transporter permease n=1 Tax=Halorubellus sp. JP-L1 TaxID=2715753 RepID=UPI00140AE937|nr:amino acid ABC transporter permease [Halorubellus sp. JP-L1]NHN41181.1 amino acid ABC transporter permease [Halorubellus sp. JP-L1]
MVVGVGALLEVVAVCAGLPADWQFVCQNADYLAGGLLLTVALTIASILLGFAAGFPAGAIEVYGSTYAKLAVEIVGVVLRGTPIVVIFIFTFFVFPVTEWFPIHRVLPVSDAFVAAVVGLGLRSAAYQAQLFRGSLQSVDAGQMEAARAVGLSKVDAIRHVVVPQALRRSVPGFQNEFTIVLKDTSVAIAIGLAELLTRSQELFVQETTAVTEVILAISAVYFVLTFGTNRALDQLNERYAIPEDS